MSKRKPSRQKEVPAKPDLKKAAKSGDTSKSGFLESFSRMIFIVVMVLAAAFAVYRALIAEDAVNAYIEENLPNLLRTEGMIFGIIAAGFVYCAFKMAFRLKQKAYDYAVLLVVLGAMIFNFSISFDKDIGSFGDNASYINNAHSLVKYGAPYKLYHVDKPYDYKAALGLPIMLTPIVAIWGMDVIKMKYLVFAMGSLALIFFFLAFKRRLGFYAAAIMTILLGTYPMIVFNTSYVMTEVPFIFIISVTLYLSFLFMDARSVRSAIPLGIALALITFLCYLTRAVGIGVIAGTCLWLFTWIPWKAVVKKQESLWTNLNFRKFAALSIVLAVLVMAWQFRTPETAVETDESGLEQVVPVKSQAATFMGSDLAENFKRNFNLVKPLWSQQIFSETLSRWYLSLGKAGQIKTFGGDAPTTGLVLFNLALLVALITGLMRRQLVAFWFLFIILATLLGSRSTVSVVFSRYLIVVVPFIVYLLMDMLINGSRWLSERYTMPKLERSGLFAAVLFSYFMLSHNFSGTAFNNQRQNAGDTYTIAFDNYILAAQWMKKNVEKGSVVASRKPRLFYVFSEMPGVMTVSYVSQTYSQEVEDEILNRMTDRGVDYLVLDAFSTASRKVVLPIVQNNPDKFQVVEAVGARYPAYVIRFTPEGNGQEAETTESPE